MREEEEEGPATSSGGVNGPGHFEYEDSEWDVGIGNLIIDLDADIASQQTVMPSGGAVSNSALAPSAAEQQQQQGLLKMKIKRTKPSPGTRLSETKHEIVKSNQEVNGNQNDSSKRANGVPPLSSLGVTVTPVTRVPTVKTSPLLNGSSPVTVTPIPSGGKTNFTSVLVENPPSKKIKADACVGTSDSATMTEPDCLGPCEPGTHVSLEGIVWQETEGGVLVVNVTWRGKTYVGTLLDCTNHDWAPPRFCDSPSSDLDCRASRGRAAKRGRGGATTGNGATPVPSGESPFSPMHSKLRLTVKGRRGFPATPPSPLTRRNKGRPPEETPQVGSGSAVELKPAGLIECPEPNCSKKYRHINGLRYHQSHAHGGGESPVPGNTNDTEEAEEEDEEEALAPIADETKMDTQNDDLSPSADDTQSSLPSIPAKDIDTPVPPPVPVIPYNGAPVLAEERIPTPEVAPIPDRIPTPTNGVEDPLRSPAYSDISDANEQSPTPPPVPPPVAPSVEIIENLDKNAGIPESYPAAAFVAPFYPAFVPVEEAKPREEPVKPVDLPKSFSSGSFLQYGFVPQFQGFPANPPQPPMQERKNHREEVTIIKETRSPVPHCSNSSNSSIGSVKRENTPLGRITPSTPSPKFRPPSADRDRRSEGMKPTMESHGPPGSIPYPYGLHPFPPMHMDPAYRGVIPSPFFASPPLNFLQGSSFYPLPGMAPRSDATSSKSGSGSGGQVKVERSVIQGSRPLMSGGALQVTATPGAAPAPNPMLAAPSYPPSTYPVPGKPILRP